VKWTCDRSEAFLSDYQGRDLTVEAELALDKDGNFLAVRGSTAYATIKGFEVMRALRKSQAAIFHITREIRGEACLVERAFGLGASALAEAVQFVSERLELDAA
jgi:CO/xanthine dehydrogenase Mo-binding subunit